MSIKKHIPNSITCCNLLSGSVSIYFALVFNDIKMASLFIIFAAVFDFFDGLSARALGVSSPIGKDLDSLADVVSFGVAPSMLILSVLSKVYPLSGGANYIAFATLFIGAFAALRLAKFNNDTRQSTSFIGLAVPANALFWIGYASILTEYESIVSFDISVIYIITFAFVALFSYLMVSELPMFSLKLSKDKGIKQYIPPFIMLGAALLLSPWMGLAGFAPLIILYILICIVIRVITKDVKL